MISFEKNCCHTMLNSENYLKYFLLNKMKGSRVVIFSDTFL